MYNLDGITQHTQKSFKVKTKVCFNQNLRSVRWKKSE